MADFGKLNFAVAFNPQTAFPLDARYYFASLTEAEAAAASAVEVGSSKGTYFFGENICVVTENAADLYVIQPNGTLKAAGSEIFGDNKSIDLGDGNILSLKNFGKKYYKYVPATEDDPATYTLVEDGTFPAGLQPKTRLADDGTIELAWYEPSSTTVEGLAEQMSSLSETVNTMQSNVSAAQEAISGLEEDKADKSDTYTKSETDSAINAAIAASGHAHFEVAETVPTAETAEENVLYLVKNEDTDFYDIYALVGTEVVRLDDTTVDLSKYATTDEMNTAITAAVASKVDAEAGKGLSTNDYTNADKEKLAALNVNAEENYIKSVSEELAVSDSGKLSIQAVDQSKVTGLPEALAAKVEKVEGKVLSSNDFTDEAKAKLEGIESKAQVNLIEVIKMAGEALNITDKAVNIPLAVNDTLGIVKGSTAENQVAIAEDGYMEVNSLNVNKLVQTDGEVLYFNGGNASKL